MDALLSIAEPLARSQPPRELILARLVVPQRLGHRASPRRPRAPRRDRGPARGDETLHRGGLSTRAVAFTTPDAGEDLVRLGRDERIDLVLVDGRRPLLGDGIPKGEVGASSRTRRATWRARRARARRDRDRPEHPVVRPVRRRRARLGGARARRVDRPRAAAPLRLLGASFDVEQGPATRARCSRTPRSSCSSSPGSSPSRCSSTPAADVIRKAAGAGLLVVGLSERWREEGLGELRSEIVKAAPAPVLLVRRGTRAARSRRATT